MSWVLWVSEVEVFLGFNILMWFWLEWLKMVDVGVGVQ